MSESPQEFHERMMHRVLKLAQKGFIQIAPDPFRGALVAKDKAIVGEGFMANRRDKEPELHALSAAGDKAQGATLYLNLEPAYGKGVVEQIIAAGIVHVVVAMKEPNPNVAGKSLKALEKAGLEVTTSVLEAEAQELNEIYIKDVSTRRPFVHVLTAMSLDGKTATAMGDSQGITGPEAKEYVQQLRARYDAVMIGVNSILHDDPQLNCKALRGCDPWRIVVDSQARTPTTSRLFLRSDLDESRAPVLIAISYGAHEEHLRSLRHAGAEIIHCPDENSAEPRVDLSRLMIQLNKRGITSVLIEGGSTLRGAALEAGIVDKMTFLMAPKIFGSADARSAIDGEGATIVSEARELKRLKARYLGSDIVIEGYLA